jgi:hypothetical protein
MINIILLVIALVCFIAAAANYPPNRPYAIGWLGAAFVVLSLLIPGLGAH